jgi:hypothetical protein
MTWKPFFLERREFVRAWIERSPIDRKRGLRDPRRRLGFTRRIDDHAFDRAGLKLGARGGQVDLCVDVLGTDGRERPFELQAGVKRQRAGIDLLAGEIGPFLDLVAIACLDREPSSV